MRAGNASEGGLNADRPTNVLLAEKLTLHLLGALVALHEHFVFTQGTMWGIDSLDRWTSRWARCWRWRSSVVESTAEPELSHDSSANTLILRYRELKG